MDSVSKALLLVLLGLTAIPVQAQVGTQSAISGVVISGSDTFAPAPTSSVPTAVGGATVAAVNSAGATVLSQLNQGTLVSSLSPETQQTFVKLLTDFGFANSPEIKALGASLAKAPGAPSAELVSKLIQSLAGLQANGKVSLAQLGAAIQAYNSLIDSAGDAYLSKPPAELKAIQTVLAELTKSLPS